MGRLLQRLGQWITLKWLDEDLGHPLQMNMPHDYHFRDFRKRIHNLT